MSAGFRRHLVGKTHRNVCYSATTITALSVGYWSYGHFVKQLVEFYLNNIVNLHPLTPYIMRSYAHKMANVLWPQILWRQFTQCVVELVASLNYYPKPPWELEVYEYCSRSTDSHFAIVPGSNPAGASFYAISLTPLVGMHIYAWDLNYFNYITHKCNYIIEVSHNQWLHKKHGALSLWQLSILS